MIASPGDVLEERNLIRDILHEWNDVHSIQRNCVLMPVGWETHSAPDLGGPPQALINKNVLEQCDLLIGVFWTRIGTPTGVAESGTVEEIRKHIGAGKPAMVYFSSVPVAPASLEPSQYEALKDFKKWCKNEGLIQHYENLPEFSEKFRKQLQLMIRDNDYLAELLSESSQALMSERSSEDLNAIWMRTLSENKLSAEAQELLKAACEGKGGTILSLRFINGQTIQANGRNFVDSGDRRSVARWEAALKQLLDHELVVARGYKNEVFEVTDKGYRLVDTWKSDSA